MKFRFPVTAALGVVVSLLGGCRESAPGGPTAAPSAATPTPSPARPDAEGPTGPPTAPTTAAPGSVAPVVLTDDFEADALRPHWIEIRGGDPRSPLSAPRLGRLTLSLETLGADPTTLKVVGVRTRDAHRLSVVEWRLDWNAQANGSYLKAALYLSPQATTGDPAALSDWIRVEHVGVPPGSRWRHTVFEQRNGSLRPLDLAGWPEERGGRAPGAPVARLTWAADGAITYAEDGVVLSRAKTLVPVTAPLFAYLTLTGHSNYPLRTVFVDDVRLIAP